MLLVYLACLSPKLETDFIWTEPPGAAGELLGAAPHPGLVGPWTLTEGHSQSHSPRVRLRWNHL